MSEINFDYFLDDVMPSFGGAQPALVLLHIRNAAIKFCEQSWAWQLDGLPINVVANNNSYDFVSPILRAEIADVLTVQLDGRKLDPTSWVELEQRYNDAANRKGLTKQYWQDYVEQLKLFPIPESNGLMEYRIALRPSRVANGMDGSVAKRYFDAISNGAKASLYEIPRKPWSDGRAAVFHAAEFKRLVSKAKVEVMRGLGRRGALRTVLVR